MTLICLTVLLHLGLHIRLRICYYDRIPTSAALNYFFIIVTVSFNMVKTTITLWHKCCNLIYTTWNKALQILFHLKNKDSIGFATWLMSNNFYMLFFGRLFIYFSIGCFSFEITQRLNLNLLVQKFSDKSKIQLLFHFLWKLYFSLQFAF